MSVSTLILRLGICGSLLGLALGHLLVDQPYRAFFWDQALLEGLINACGIPWATWVTDTAYSDGIDTYARLIGWVFLLAALTAWLPERLRAWRIAAAAIISGPLLFRFLCGWLAHGQDLCWPPEYALRLSIPLLLIWGLHSGQGMPRWLLQTMLIACAATFIGHGCYAIGLAPTPLAFRQMLQAVLPVGEGATTGILHLVGLLDILVAALLLWPAARRPALLWMAAWGLLTALLRLSAVDTTFLADSLPAALAASLERLIHAAGPLACWYWLAHHRTETPCVASSSSPCAA